MHRRDFIFGAAVVTAGSMLLRPSRAEAAVAETMAIVAGASRLISAFTRSGDGGLSAYLQSIRNLQLETLNQIGVIHVELGKLHNAIASLPEEMTGVVRGEQLLQLQAKINGCYEQLVESYNARRRMDDFTAAQIAAAKKTEDELRQRVVGARQTLTGHPTIACTPHAAMIMAYAFPIELTARYFFNEHPSTIGDVIKTYREWAKSILDRENKYSSMHHFMHWSNKHERLYTEGLKVNAFSKRMLESQKYQDRLCFTYQEHQPYVESTGHYTSAGRPSESIDDAWVEKTPAVPERYGETTNIYGGWNSQVVEQGGAQIFEVTELKETDDDGVGALFLDCEVVTKAPFISRDKRLEAIRSRSEFGLVKYSSSLKQAQAAVTKVNLARLQMAFGANAIVIASEMESQFRVAEEFYAK